MIECIKCNNMLDGAMANTGELQSCSSCGALTRIDVFKAQSRDRPSASAAETLLEDGAAGCFYHPRKKAVIPCSACGRFLCSLCDVELDGSHICFSCLETGKKKKKIQNLVNNRTLHDSIALSLALYPALIVYPTIITAPIVFYVCIRYWKAPTSLLARTKIRFIIAGILAILQILGWILLFVYIV